jgi:hypothetical protein
MILGSDYSTYRYFESWPVRIKDGVLYRSLVLFGYNPYQKVSKKLYKQQQHKIFYGFLDIDFKKMKDSDYMKKLGIEEWFEDENCDSNLYLKTGRKYGWTPVYEKNSNLSELRQKTDLYYIEGYYNLVEENLHILRELINDPGYKNILDGYYFCIGRKIPGTSGSRENITQTYRLFKYDFEKLDFIFTSFDEVKSYLETHPKCFGMIFKCNERLFKVDRYSIGIALTNKFDIYFARKEYPLDGLV